MNKMKKIVALAACAAMVTTLAGCTKSAKYTKVGFGTVVTPKLNEDGTLKQVDTTMVALGLDSKGKIAYLDLDVAQQKTEQPEELRTKEEKELDYNMKGASKIGKEWYEQAEAYEAFAIGKTVEELTAADVADEKGYPANADLKAGCTMNISAFQEAVKKAAANLADVKADKIGAGEDININAKGQVNNNIAVVALDAKGKIVWSYLDTAQTLHGHGDETQTKKELKEAYAMKAASGIGKELYEQLQFVESYLVGKTAEDVKALELDNGGKAVDADLASGCTVTLGGYHKALVEALENAAK